MDLYLILILIVLPGKGAPTQELQRQWISASSQQVCEAHATALANKQRQLQANVLQSSGGQVRAECRLQLHKASSEA